MALPSSGQISLSQVNTELGNASTAQINMGSAAVRALFDIASGAISMSDGYGKSSVFTFSITSNQTNANLRTLALNAGWDGSSAVEATINSGVIITGNTAGNSTAAMTVDGSWLSGVTLINNGVIVGRGGNGGNGANSSAGPINGSPGSTGGRALLVSTAVSINNQGTIAGGGGGGGGGGNESNVKSGSRRGGGGGGGGGRSSLTNSSGGAGGNGLYFGTDGGSGTYSSAGTGGVGGRNAGDGGNGGNWGASGANGQNVQNNAGGSGGSGGSAGQAVNGNSNITWIATGTRLGPIV